jgi:hypothetical protein
MFNDTFSMTSAPNTLVPFTYSGVAWDVDVGRKFANPPDMSNNTWGKYEKPAAWSKQANMLDPNNTSNNGLTNVDFMVWMRTAALPNFRKLYRRLDRGNVNYPAYSNGLPAGTYQLQIDYSKWKNK